MLIVTSIGLFWYLFYQTKNRKIIEPSTIWTALWAIVTLFGGLRLYSMKSSSVSAQLVMIIGILSFIGGTYALHYIYSKNDKSKKENKLKLNTLFSPETNKKIVYLFLGISLIFNVVFFVRALLLLLNGLPYAELRDIMLNYSNNTNFKLFPSTFFSTFYSWIANPITTLLICIVIGDLVRKRYSLIFKILCFFNVGLLTFYTSGRLLVLNIALMLGVSIVYYWKYFDEKKKKILLGTGLSLVLVLIVMTVFRQKSDSAVPSYYSYFAIESPLFSHWKEYFDNAPHYVFGNAFFRGILEGVNFFTQKLNIYTPNYQEMQNLLSLTQESWVEIFPNNWYNAYVTCFYYFYIDAGVIGVIIESALFGMIVQYIYLCVTNHKGELFVFYLIFAQIIFSSFMRWQLGNFTTISLLGCTAVCFFHFKRRNNK